MHPATPPPSEVGDDWSGVTVCMHVRDYQTTTASMICEVHRDERVPNRAWFALGSPCVSVFVPSFGLHVPPVLSSPDTWLCFDQLRRRAEADVDEYTRIRATLAALEADLWERADAMFAMGVIDPAWDETVAHSLAAGLE